MLKNFLIVFLLIGRSASLFSQSKFAFWKKDREYAKNSFTINTSGPIPGFGFSFNHQLNKLRFPLFTGSLKDLKSNNPIQLVLAKAIMNLRIMVL